MAVENSGVSLCVGLFLAEDRLDIVPERAVPTPGPIFWRGRI